jgi:TonB-dependent starch-binding outer membrane protein SusC
MNDTKNSTKCFLNQKESEIKNYTKIYLMKQFFKLTLCVVVFLFSVGNSWAQQRTITGTVTDQEGLVLPGVTIVEKGTVNGTVTNTDGKYSITVSQGAQALIFTFVGMKSQEIALGISSSYDVKMESETIGLEEVVAIGYGTAKKRDVTGSVGSVRADAIALVNPVQPAKALQGQVAGVNVNKINSRPGSDYRIEIRGVQSISFSSEPLVVIDGVMGGKMNTLKSERY